MTNTVIINLTLLIASIGILITSIEKLMVYYTYSDSNILSWEVARYRHKWTFKSRISNILNALLNQSTFRYLIIFAIVCAALSIFNLVSPIPKLTGVISLCLLVYFFLYLTRNIYGTDGADQMNLILIVSIFLFSILDKDSLIKNYPIYFIAIQLSLSYFISGIAKLRSKKWRNGEAITGILSANAYGNKIFYNLLKDKKRTSLFLCWFVILFEIFWLAIFIVPLEYQIVLIGLGISFHLMIAIVMGLNNFFYSFLGAYPSLLFLLNIM